MLTIARVLFAGGEETDHPALRQALESAGHAISHAASLEDATRHVLSTDHDVLVLTNGMERSLEQLVSARCSDAAAVVVLMPRPTVTDVRDALRGGASDVVDASGGEHVLLAAIERAARDGQLRRELSMLRARVGDASQQTLIGRSAAMTHVRELVGRAAGSRVPVVIAGEAGTGKDTVARLVHDLSERAPRPYAMVRCDGDQGALERELFGTAEGGFSNAGLLERVRGGTVVIEEASALSLPLRARLGRVALTRLSQRVGGVDSLPADVRLIFVVRTEGQGAGEQRTPGTTGALAALGRNGERLKHDDGRSVDALLHAFNAMLIEVPPLRERRSDIPQLVQHFRRRVALEHNFEPSPMSPDDMLPLLGRAWPGNVRELEQCVERAAFETPGELSGADANPSGIEFGHAQVTLEALERAYILHVLQRESGHQSRAATRLGIDRRTLYRKLKQYRMATSTQE